MSRSDRERLSSLVRQAIGGNRAAIEELLRSVADDVYGLALRMLWNTADAEDATQEILVKLTTRLTSFDHRASFRTWVYRIASNHLLDIKRSPLERMKMTFEEFAEDLAHGQEPLPEEHAAMKARLTEEVRIGCTMGMLQCLDRSHRLAYVLGEILDFSSPDAAYALDISEATFRKRLSRARQRITEFTRQYCGLVDETAACRCERRIAPAILAGRVRPNDLAFARDNSVDSAEVAYAVQQLDGARRTVALYRSQHAPTADRDLARKVIASLALPGTAG